MLRSCLEGASCVDSRPEEAPRSTGCCSSQAAAASGRATDKASRAVARPPLTVLCRAQCAHIMAMAVQRLHPRVQVTIGPWIERGFYYDFDTPEDERLTEADLKAVKKEMQRIIKANLPFSCEEVCGAVPRLPVLPVCHNVVCLSMVPCCAGGLPGDAGACSRARAAGVRSVHWSACCARGAGRASLCTLHMSARRPARAQARAPRARQVSPEEASRRIAAINEPYKQEILDGILARTPDAPITVYHIGGSEHAEHWWDLCGGPHVASTGKINPAAVDLESLAGAAPDRLGCGPAPRSSPRIH